MNSETKPPEFRKKVYKKLDSSPLSQTIPSFSQKPSEKKIILTSATKGLREEFKKTFLPLLIDIFELRQMIDNHKSQKESPSVPLGKVSKSPREILEQLEQRQKDIEEAQRWCDGVILQIAKGIEEAKEALAILDQDTTQEKPGLLKRLLKFGKK